MIKLRCQACSKLIGIQGGKPGQRIKCPHCQTPNVLPSEQPAATEPAAASASAKPPVKVKPAPEVQLPAPVEAPVADPQTPVAPQAQDVPQVNVAPQMNTAPQVNDVAPQAAPGQPEFPNFEEPQPVAQTRQLRKRKKSAAGAIVTCLVCTGLLIVVGVVAVISLGGSDEPSPTEVATALKLKPIQDATVVELQDLQLQASLDAPADQAVYQLVEGPDGLKVDAQTGQITWQPTEQDGPGEFKVMVGVAASSGQTPTDVKTFRVQVAEQNSPPRLEPIGDVELQPGQAVTLQAVASDDDEPKSELQFSLGADAPSGARIDPSSGQLTWTPDSAAYGKDLSLEVVVTETGVDGLSAAQRFTVRVAKAPNQPILDLAANLQQGGASVEIVGEALAAPFSGSCQEIRVDGQRVRVIQYDSADAAQGEAKQVTADAKEAFGKPARWNNPHLYRQDRLIAIYDGRDDKLIARLDQHLGQPFAIGEATSTAPLVAQKPDQPSADQQALLDLLEKKQLFKPTSYAAIREFFAQQFADSQQDVIKQALGDDYDALTAWLEEHKVIREELFTAIQPEFDDVSAVLKIFNEIRKQFPDKIASYANLAIAVSVTWDQPRGGVYDYNGHARRTKSTMPEGLMDAVANFKYFLDAEQYMQGRAQFLPWEFLVHLVNHKTPEGERVWAIQNYLPKRVMFGKCYHDVPYDTEMLNSKSAVCKLDGHPYTLPNLRDIGGVCAMQADFAARVGKSMGVPAEYVRGESAFGEYHAWVMWVELKNVTKTSIAFSLESHGRYRGDKYYVGELRSPHTGQPMTDRDLELRLHTVGVNAANKRHAELIMRAYPKLRKQMELDIGGQLDFLEDVIKLCPWNEAAWIAVSQISKDESLDRKHHKQMFRVLDGMLRTFAAFPDFTWKIFDDLIAFVPTSAKRNELYVTWIDLYASAGRPDLACEARLKLSDHLVADGQQMQAIQGLAGTIKVIPSEGRYVPRMLDKLEAICLNVDGASDHLVGFYATFLPLIPQMRGNRPSDYCMKMFERGIQRFRQYEQAQLAQTFEAQLAKIRAGMGRKN